MLKLLAMGTTLFILPFNEWLMLESSERDLIVIRGVSGSDCIYPREQSREIACIKWSEPELDVRRKFWSKWGIEQTSIQPPSKIYQLMMYVVLFQLAIFLIDLGATLVMCCRYRLQKSSQWTSERCLSLILSTIIFICYLIVITVVISANGEFIVVKEPMEAHLGSAFMLLIADLFIFTLGWALVSLPRLLLSDTEENREATIQQRVLDRWTRLMSPRNTTNRSAPRRSGAKEERVRLQNR